MMHGVQAGHNRKQGLCCADVARRFFSSNVLFACLHCHAKGLTSAAINRHTNNPPRHRSLVLIAGREESGVGTTEPHWNAKALRATHDNVCPHGAWRLE